MKIKSLVNLFLSLLVSGSMLVSCSKTNSNTSNAPTEDDAADMVSTSVEPGSGGFTDQLYDAGTIAVSNGFGKHVNNGSEFEKLVCGVPFDTSITKTYSGPNVTVSYTHQLEYLLNCADSTLSLSASFMGSYDGPLVTGERTGTKNWTLSGFGPAFSVWTLNGDYNALGTWTMKVRNKNTFNNTVKITAVNVTVDKTSYRITGGGGTVDITSIVSNGNTYVFKGTITFNGDHTATLIINGHTYTILI